jgi:hypothetical protein
VLQQRFGRLKTLTNCLADFLTLLSNLFFFQSRMITSGPNSSSPAIDVVVAKPVGFIGEFEQIARKFPFVLTLFGVGLSAVRLAFLCFC